MFGSTSTSSAGKRRFLVSSVRTANQNSPSRGALKLNEGRSGVVVSTLSQLPPPSLETQSWTCLYRGRSAGSITKGTRKARCLLGTVGTLEEPAGAAGATEPKVRARPKPKLASRLPTALFVTTWPPLPERPDRSSSSFADARPRHAPRPMRIPTLYRWLSTRERRTLETIRPEFPIARVDFRSIRGGSVGIIGEGLRSPTGFKPGSERNVSGRCGKTRGQVAKMRRSLPLRRPWDRRANSPRPGSRPRP